MEGIDFVSYVVYCEHGHHLPLFFFLLTLAIFFFFLRSMRSLISTRVPALFLPAPLVTTASGAKPVSPNKLAGQFNSGLIIFYPPIYDVIVVFTPLPSHL
jgi:hypothetical protein